MFASSLIPTINKPTPITHPTATLIDNIYVKLNELYAKVNSAILVTDISDHLPIFCFTSYNKPSSQKNWKPLTFKKRRINEYTKLINNVPFTKIAIPYRNIKMDPWLSKGLMKSSCACAKLYSKCINKSKTDITYKSYIKYRNMYNQLKKIAKQTYL